MVVAWTWVLGPGVAGPVMRHLPRHWFRVPTGERVLHRVLGVGIFGWLLERSGWNRHLAKPMRGFDGSRAGLLSLERSVRGGASAHGTCFAIHVLLAALALFTGHPWGALWMLLPGVAFISTRCCYSAPSCFDSSLCWISPAPEKFDLRPAKQRCNLTTTRG